MGTIQSSKFAHSKFKIGQADGSKSLGGFADSSLIPKCIKDICECPGGGLAAASKTGFLATHII
ncbi:hypothetical protein DP117_14520 [Brasilonema sp. UFV-L1]|nr:hypothetical protein [Brasilonema sp. UFV-L1]